MKPERIHNTTCSDYYTFHGLPSVYKTSDAIFDDSISAVWPCGVILNAGPDRSEFIGKIATPQSAWAVIAVLYVRSADEFAIDEFGTPADIMDNIEGDELLLRTMCEIEPRLFAEELMVHRFDRQLNVLVRRAEFKIEADANQDYF